MSTKPTLESVIGLLTKERLQHLAREFNLSIAESLTKGKQVQNLVRSGIIGFEELLKWLGRDELKEACEKHGLADEGRSRAELAARLLKAHGKESTAQPIATKVKLKAGAIVQVRQRQYMVEKVTQPTKPKEKTRVDLICLDDDSQGKFLSVLWEMEIGAKVLDFTKNAITAKAFDPPNLFAAYLNAMRWNSVTATDPTLFQSPFRAGIQIMDHQLIPLQKALQLPRCNLFIADDVGLGKTIEAGLVLQELLLRQRVDFSLIVCPASVALQWRDEMRRKFGLHFELYNRNFLASRRKERGFAVNPWATHNRFIISYQLLRRPEYRDPLLQHIGERISRSLLILDEAHTAAPATSSRYAIDSKVTQVIRDVAPRFENRLFLSATPHNGHSNSFSALLELLDPHRFTRGIKVDSAEKLSAVMVRRLKDDLRQLGKAYPERQVIQVNLRHTNDAWSASFGSSAALAIGKGTNAEIELAIMLSEYRKLMEPEKGRGKLAFIGLQKRLLSSIEAFARTLSKHAASLNRRNAFKNDESDNADDDEYGEIDFGDEIDQEVIQASAELAIPLGRAKDLLEKMQQVANQSRNAADAKALALIAWLRENLCAAIGATGNVEKAARVWSDRRVIIFTEFNDSKIYLQNILSEAIAETDLADERIMQFHGGLGDDQREYVQQAFNGSPAEYPVRILLATDAAREGVNLQGHCADLFHYDIPWNPARMEQRNGRIDRTLQSEPIVRCYYFTYPDRPEDMVLNKIIGKIGTIQRELGSLSAVVMEQLEGVLVNGIVSDTEAKVEKAGIKETARTAVSNELEVQRTDLQKVKKEIDAAARLLNNSRSFMQVDARGLQATVEMGLRLGGATQGLIKVSEAPPSFRLPAMPDSWVGTLDWLRPPRKRDEEFWNWRKQKPVPVIFEPAEAMTTSVAQLHLEHPLVQRILSRFRAQGTSAHDLEKVTGLVNKDDSEVRLVIFGRFSLFGIGAARLHDEIIAISVNWQESKGKDHLKPLSKVLHATTMNAMNKLLANAGDKGLTANIEKKLLGSAADDFAKIWPLIEADAEAHLHDAKQKLEARGAQEAADLAAIIENQRKLVKKQIAYQMEFEFDEFSKEELRQYDENKQYWENREKALEKELKEEPERIKQLYQVAIKRLEPVGMVYLWPKSRT